MAELFKEAQKVAIKFQAESSKVAKTTAGTDSTNSLPPRSLNFSHSSSVSDFNGSTRDSKDTPNTRSLLRKTTFTKADSPCRQRKTTFTLDDSPLNNLSETLNKALPHVESVTKDENGAVVLTARRVKAEGEAAVKRPGAGRGAAVRRSLPTSRGALKPVGLKLPSQVRLDCACSRAAGALCCCFHQNTQCAQKYAVHFQSKDAKRASVGLLEKRPRYGSSESVDDAMSIASTDSEASFSLPSGKRGLPPPKLRVS